MMNLLAGCFIAALIILLPAQEGAAAKRKAESSVERGLYLVTAAGCNDCHSPKTMTPTGPLPDKGRLLSGHPAGDKLPAVPPTVIGPDQWGALASRYFTGWVGMWGTSYSTNLTPDPETGTGTWTEDLFIRILRTGKFMGSGRDILPPMPWSEYAKLSDQDLKAVFAYLKSMKPIRNQVPVSVPAL